MTGMKNRRTMKSHSGGSCLSFSPYVVLFAEAFEHPLRNMLKQKDHLEIVYGGVDCIVFKLRNASLPRKACLYAILINLVNVPINPWPRSSTGNYPTTPTHAPHTHKRCKNSQVPIFSRNKPRSRYQSEISARTVVVVIVVVCPSFQIHSHNLPSPKPTPAWYLMSLKARLPNAFRTRTHI